MAPPQEPANPAEEYAVWLKNVRFLYDLVISQGQTWPSLTLQWLPGKQDVPERGYTRHKLLLGTHTSSTDQDYLLVREAKLPLNTVEALDDVPEEQQGRPLAATEGRISTVQKIAHQDEVNRARYMPQKPHFVATKSPSSDVYIFDLTAHPAAPAKGSRGPKPNMTLTGHTDEGFGVAWSPLQEGRLLSGANDKTVCLWDIAQGGKVLPASAVYKKHSDIVNDVAWHQSEPNIFGSVSEDKTLVLWDARLAPEAAATASQELHSEGVNALAFHPSRAHLFATGSSDKSVGLFDLRRLDQRLHTLEAHEGDVYHVAWSPHSEPVLATGGKDHKVMLWDLSRIGDEQEQEDAADGAPELLLVHSGHSSGIEDMAWCPDEPWTLASIDNDNLLQIWQPTESVYQD